MTERPALLVTHEPLEARLAGPAVRAWHLAHQVAAVRPVQLAAPHLQQIHSSDVTLLSYNRITGAPLRTLANQAAVVMVSGYLLRRYPGLVQAGAPLVVDLYDPFVLENLEIHASKPLQEQVSIHQSNLAVLADQLGLGDFFICASETQRDFWLGMLTAQGRVNPYTLADDATLRRLIDVVPFGLPDVPPTPDRGAIRECVPGIGRDDRIIYWGGGIWDWLDPLTLIRAVAEIAGQRDDVRLFFAGVRHPSLDVPPMRMCQTAMDLSRSLDLTDRVVFFNDWVPYDTRGAYLLDADVGVSLHFAHVETRFAFRTRLLDYLWAGLPMVVTRGDAVGELVAQYNLGQVVEPQDQDSVREALLTLLDARGFRAEAAPRMEAARAGLRWGQVSAPLQAFCTRPYRSADWSLRKAPGRRVPAWIRAWRVLRQRGPRALARETRGYLSWRLKSD